MKINKTFIIFLAFLIQNLIVNPSIVSGDIQIKQNQDSYSIILTQLEGINLSTGNQYLVNNIPLLIKEEINSITEHILTQEEIQAVRDNAKNSKLLEIYEKIREEKNKRDQTPYTSNSDKQKTNFQTKIDNYLKDIQEINQYPLETIEVKNPLPVNFLSSNKQGQLFSPPKFSPLIFTQENKGDLLITGSIEEIFDYLYLEIQVFDRLRSKILFTYNNSGQAIDILKEVDEIQQKIIPIILGREYGSLRISLEQAKAFIFLDGSFAGIGTTSIPYLEPGNHKINVMQKGFIAEELEVTIKNGEELEVPVSLQSENLAQVEVTTEPSEAKLYENSRYIGITPLSLLKYNSTSQIIVRKEGYLDSSFHVDKNTPPNLNITMIPDNESLSDIQHARRMEFYTAFGWFLLSIPIPIVADAMRIDLNNYYINNYGVNDIQNIYTTIYVLDGVRLGSWILIGGLGVHMLWRLFVYIDASNKLAG